jgi:hypothetical protein
MTFMNNVKVRHSENTTFLFSSYVSVNNGIIITALESLIQVWIHGID